MRFYALVEDWPGESKAYFRELPGCLSSAPTYEEAVKTAPVAILTFLKWLKKNDKIGMPMAIQDVVEMLSRLRQSTPERIGQLIHENFTRLLANDPWLRGVGDILSRPRW